MQDASFFWGVGFLFDCSFPLVLKQGTPGCCEGFQFSGGEVSFPGVAPVYSSDGAPLTGALSADCSGGT